MHQHYKPDSCQLEYNKKASKLFIKQLQYTVCFPSPTFMQMALMSVLMMEAVYYYG